ncbi:MAG: glycosyl transferase [Sphingobacteriales bacterium UTBCD1]|jgi:ADP-heptose:LPS heptosyltransferase|nr:MAG: glycosyl transferase [Sphingobacteriales bacterium UTBCD1]
MSKILVIRFSSIGDIVLVSPVFRCIKKQLPGTELHFLTKSKFRPVTVHNPYIDQFFYFDNDLSAVIKELKREHYDYIIDLHKNFRSFKVKLALRKPSFTIRKLNFQKFLLTQMMADFMPKRHITLRSLDTVAPLGVRDDGLGLDYFISEDDEIIRGDLPPAHQNGYVAVVIGATYYTKKLPVYKLQELCARIKMPVILVGGKEDIEAGEEIAGSDPQKIFNACGKYSLNQSADIVRKSVLVVSHDTGLQYIACAFNKRVFAVWGSTSPKLQVEPYYGTSYENPPYENILLSLYCQPCSKYGRNKCPLGHFNCMNHQDMNALAVKVNRYAAAQL